ncbi:hypothetical protein [Desertivirga xinjiangensis]|uniref:hypothetical protein n=1 Tax=Desertivirga xinjiangensis TaxID=539206 RepID=UPI00210DF954|nr:hypothetical protein [Pedobacter xinjiangensis]
MNKTLHLLSILALLFVGFISGCQKSDKKAPCEELISEAAPTYIFVKVVDKQTGANIIASNNLTSNEVKVTVGQTTEQLAPQNWRITTNASTSPYYSVLQLLALPAGEGQYIRKITLGNFGDITLNYKVSKKENTSDSPCSSQYYYSVSEVSITDHPFELLKIQGQDVPNFLVVAL